MSREHERRRTLHSFVGSAAVPESNTMNGMSSIDIGRHRQIDPPAPLPYHRIAHLTATTGKWWRPLVVILLGAVLLAGAFVIYPILVTLAGVLLNMAPTTSAFDDPRNPMDLMVALGSVAVGVPVILFAFRWGSGRHRSMRGTVHSVRGRFRWHLVARAGLVVFPIVALVNLVSFLVMPPPDLSAPPASWSLVLAYVVILVLTPLQCAAEEYVYRALPLQTFGTWLRPPLWGIILPVPLFMVAHEYGWVGQIDIATFAVCMGILTWKTGGIECAILLHTAHNLTLLLLGTWSPSSMKQGGEEPLTLLFSLPPLFVLTFGLMWWISRREKLAFWEALRGSGHLETARASGRSCPNAVDGREQRGEIYG